MLHLSTVYSGPFGCLLILKEHFSPFTFVLLLKQNYECRTLTCSVVFPHYCIANFTEVKALHTLHMALFLKQFFGALLLLVDLLKHMIKIYNVIWPFYPIKSKVKVSFIVNAQYVQDIQRIEITLPSDPRCNNEHLP